MQIGEPWTVHALILVGTFKLSYVPFFQLVHPIFSVVSFFGLMKIRIPLVIMLELTLKPVLFSIIRVD